MKKCLPTRNGLNLLFNEGNVSRYSTIKKSQLFTKCLYQCLGLETFLVLILFFNLPKWGDKMTLNPDPPHWKIHSDCVLKYICIEGKQGRPHNKFTQGQWRIWFYIVKIQFFCSCLQCNLPEACSLYFVEQFLNSFQRGFQLIKTNSMCRQFPVRRMRRSAAAVWPLTSTPATCYR